MINASKNVLKRKAIHDFNAFLNAESIDCFFFRYLIQLLRLLKNYKRTKKKMFHKKLYI